MIPTLKRQDYTFSWGGKCFPFLFEDILAESLQQYPFLDTFWVSDGKFLRVYWSKKARVQATQYGTSILGTLDQAKQYCQQIADAKEQALMIETSAPKTFTLFEQQIAPLKEFLYKYIALDPEFTNDFLEEKNDQELLMFLGKQKNLFREDINQVFFEKTGPYQQLISSLAAYFAVSFDFVQSLSLEQLASLFAGRQLQSVQDVFFIHIFEGTKEYIFESDDIRALMKEFAPQTYASGESYLRGVSVSMKGVFQGRVKKVILSYEKFREELAEENISSDKDFVLVADHTTPELVPLMKKSIAIVTDMGGILSHAAITAREFGIPCVVGTESATLLLQTGDLVEVDTEKGLVRVLEKN